MLFGKIYFMFKIKIIYMRAEIIKIFIALEYLLKSQIMYYLQQFRLKMQQNTSSEKY